MIIHEMKQGTPEWLSIRKGKFTASNFSKLFMKKDTIGYQEVINQVVFERLTDELPESFSNEWMQRGTELEPLAREQYELKTFNKVIEVGFIERDEWVGCSPDGLIGKDGMVQIKSPKWSTLIDYHLNGEIPKNYYIQMQGELYVSGRQWNDFFVYHPKLKPLLKRVDRDEKFIGELKSKLDEAITEAQKRIKKIQ